MHSLTHIVGTLWKDCQIDVEHLALGNVFRTPKEAERFIPIYDAKLEESKHSRWKPKSGEIYYRIGDIREDEQNVYETSWHGSSVDYVNLAVGNCFISRTDAETHMQEIANRLKNIYENY